MIEAGGLREPKVAELGGARCWARRGVELDQGGAGLAEDDVGQRAAVRSNHNGRVAEEQPRRVLRHERLRPRHVQLERRPARIRDPRPDACEDLLLNIARDGAHHLAGPRDVDDAIAPRAVKHAERPLDWKQAAARIHAVLRASVRVLSARRKGASTHLHASPRRRCSHAAAGALVPPR
eukprot:1758854-Prymnesium_polylepis.1